MTNRGHKQQTNRGVTIQILFAIQILMTSKIKEYFILKIEKDLYRFAMNSRPSALTTAYPKPNHP